jgi:hypothetical protein
MIHKVIIGAAVLAGKGVLVAGHALGHYWATEKATELAGAKLIGAAAHTAAAHPAESLAVGAIGLGVPIVAVAYLDQKKAIELIPENPNAVRATTVKISIAGKLANGEFTTITGPLDTHRDVIMLGRYDETGKELVSQRLVKADRVEPRLANAYGQGKVVVFG